MLKVLMKSGFRSWRLPPFTNEEVQWITESIEEKDSFVKVNKELKGSGSIGKYIFYDPVKDVLFVFRFPVTGYLNVYVHIKKDNGKFGQYEDEGIKVATITSSHVYPDENQVRYLIKGWWVEYLNELFHYVVEEKKSEQTGKPPVHELKHLRFLGKEASERSVNIQELIKP